MTTAVRWRGDIRLYADARHRLGEAVVLRFARLADVAVYKAREADANFILTAGPRCEATVSHRDGAIIAVKIRVADAKLLSPRCWEHEVLHGFGLRGHPHDPGSVLSYTPGAAQAATDLDLRMLLKLYARP